MCYVKYKREYYIDVTKKTKADPDNYIIIMAPTITSAAELRNKNKATFIQQGRKK